MFTIGIVLTDMTVDASGETQSIATDIAINTRSIVGPLPDNSSCLPQVPHVLGQPVISY